MFKPGVHGNQNVRSTHTHTLIPLLPFTIRTTLTTMFTISELMQQLRNLAFDLKVTAVCFFLKSFRRKSMKAATREHEVEVTSANSDSAKSRMFSKKQTATSDSKKESDARTKRSGRSSSWHSWDRNSSRQVERLLQYYEWVNRGSGGNWVCTNSVLDLDQSPYPRTKTSSNRYDDRLFLHIPKHSAETNGPRPASRRIASNVYSDRVCRIAKANSRRDEASCSMPAERRQDSFSNSVLL